MRALIFMPFLFFSTVCKPQRTKTEKESKDTVILNHQKFIQTFENKKLQTLTTLSGDTVLKDGNYYSEVKFIDINADGYKDIRAFVFSNTPNQCENYLYDNLEKKFKLIEDCDLDIQVIKGTSYYYSYNRAGCADMNWESYLSKIEDYKLVLLGYMYGKGCDFQVKENPRTIEIYKIQRKGKHKKVLVKKLPYLKYISKFDDKWSFIKNYWTKNYESFIN
jgi:hypothetical protein